MTSFPAVTLGHPGQPHLAPASFNPNDISGITIWLKADALSLADGASISSWPDVSGFGNNAVQATGAKQPTFKTNVSNSRPAIRFDGSDDFMSIADSASYKTTAITLFVVAAGRSPPTVNRTLIGYPHTSTHVSPYWRWAITRSITSEKAEISWNGVQTGGDTGFSWLAPKIYTFTDAALYLDGNALAVTTGTNSSLTYPNATGLYIGANVGGAETWSGDIFEIILCGRSLTADEKAYVRRGLADKWL